VDGFVWEIEDRKMKHIAVFPALGYVQVRILLSTGKWRECFRITSHKKCCSLVDIPEPKLPRNVADQDPHHFGKRDPDPHQSES
jgi:hypothetical protein